MQRTLAGIGLGVLAAGILAAFIVRFLVPGTLMRFEYHTDPAILILTLTLALTLCFLSASLVARRVQAKTERSLVDQAASFEEERRRFIRRLDHEMKNPLTAIQIQLDNMQEDQAPNIPALDNVRSQADRLTLLTRGLRRLADLETRQLEFEQVDIEELMNEVVDLLQAPDRIVLDVQRLPWPIPPIEGDRELLLMAFRNLVDNALIYSSDSVEIRARHTSGYLVVEIIDTGRGIPQDELPMVKEELYRGSNVHEIPGSGLGLSIVDRIIERHRGRLELRSRPGQGTIATVQLAYEQAKDR